MSDDSEGQGVGSITGLAAGLLAAGLLGAGASFPVKERMIAVMARMRTRTRGVALRMA